MDPNKRGNPPFEPSSYAAGLERRVKRAERWNSRARAAMNLLLHGTDHEREFAKQWMHDRKRLVVVHAVALRFKAMHQNFCSDKCLRSGWTMWYFVWDWRDHGAKGAIL